MPKQEETRAGDPGQPRAGVDPQRQKAVRPDGSEGESVSDPGKRKQ